MMSQNSGNSKKPEPSTSTWTDGEEGSQDRERNISGRCEEDVMKMEGRYQEHAKNLVMKIS